MAAAAPSNGRGPPRRRQDHEWDECDDARSSAGVESLRTPGPSPRVTPARPSAGVELLRKEKLTRLARSGAPEMKFFTTTGNTGVLSQYTWTNADQFGNIANGTAQNQRLGRQIRVHRMRFVIAFSDMAGDSRVGLSFLERVDPTVAGSDLFPGNGSARAELEYPNPICTRKVYHHHVDSVMRYCGSTFGTTPSYGAPVMVVDQKWDRGLLIRYDASVAIGPTPMVWFVVDETSISASVGTQIWFTDE